MINFVQPANVVALTAPKDLKSGDGVLIGKIFSVCTVDAKNGTTFQGMIQGGVSFKKAGGYTPVQGAAAMFDAATQTLVGTGGVLVGYIYGVADPDDATRALVRLIPSAV